ncbi:MAG: alpha/beta hydrolase, partial [Actinomycetota bacterium]
MLTEEVVFYSEGEKVSALWRTPDHGDGGLRAIVHSPGWRGWKDSDHYLRYHGALTDAGFGVLVLDYRGTGGSEGARILSIRRQVQDLVNAVTYLTARVDVDPDAIAAFGSGGTGGSNAALLAAVDERVRCAVSQLPLATGADWLHRMRSESDWLEFIDRLDADRKVRVAEGRDRTVEAGSDVMVPPPEKRSPGLGGSGSRVPSEIPVSSVEELVGFDPLGPIAGLEKPVLLISIES